MFLARRPASPLSLVIVSVVVRRHHHRWWLSLSSSGVTIIIGVSCSSSGVTIIVGNCSCRRLESPLKSLFVSVFVMFINTFWLLLFVNNLQLTILFVHAGAFVCCLTLSVCPVEAGCLCASLHQSDRVILFCCYNRPYDWLPTVDLGVALACQSHIDHSSWAPGRLWVCPVQDSVMEE